MRNVCKLVMLIFVFNLVLALGSYDEALDSLMKADDLVVEMEAEGFSVFFAKDSLLEAKRYFVGMNPGDLRDKVEEDGVRKDYLEGLIVLVEDTPSYERKNLDYSEAVRLSEVVVQRREQAYRIMDEISLFEEVEAQHKGEGIFTEDALAVFEGVEPAFDGERYDEAEDILDDANFKLNEAVEERNRINSAVRATQGVFVKYWWQIIFGIVVLVGAAVPVSRKVSVYLKEKRLASLKLKMVTTKDLLKKAQENCFKAKTITTETYRIREKRYKDRMVSIENEVRILEKVLGKVDSAKDAGKAKTIGLRIGK